MSCVLPKRPIKANTQQKETFCFSVCLLADPEDRLARKMPRTPRRGSMPPAEDPARTISERPRLARSPARMDSRSTQELQRTHLIAQRKKLRTDIETMRMELQASPSRTARQRLLEAERSLAELDALHSAQNQAKEARLHISMLKCRSDRTTAHYPGLLVLDIDDTLLGPNSQAPGCAMPLGRAAGSLRTQWQAAV